MVRDPQFLYHGWKENELEIQFHTTLTPKKWKKVMIFAPELKKCNFHWWRRDILCSIEVISLIGDWFFAKFWYVVAETIIFCICITVFNFYDDIIVKTSILGDMSNLFLLSLYGRWFFSQIMNLGVVSHGKNISLGIVLCFVYQELLLQMCPNFVYIQIFLLCETGPRSILSFSWSLDIPFLIDFRHGSLPLINMIHLFWSLHFLLV